MNAPIASLIFAFGIAGLLYLDRQRAPRASKALWLPGIWIALIASRPLTVWVGSTPSGNAQLEGTPLDAAVYAALLALALVVLGRRRAQTSALLLANRWLLVYFGFCLVSVAWSYHPDVSLKRWIKAIGDLAMVLIIATDRNPLVAIRRTVSRVGFVLLPTSLLFIKYFPALGRDYDADGNVANVGVTLNKNSLGLTVLLISLVAVWNLRSLLTHPSADDRGRRLLAQGALLAFGVTLFGLAVTLNMNSLGLTVLLISLVVVSNLRSLLTLTHPGAADRGRRLLAQGALLAFGVTLFGLADCKTCIACFILGTFLLIACGRPAMAQQPARVHTVCVGLIALAGLTLALGGGPGLIETMGRDASMSGRADIWPAALHAASNPLIGAGFEGFWLSPNVHLFQKELLDKGFFPPLVTGLNEAHNGYIEVYLNLGLIGVVLLATILVSGYLNAVESIRRDREFGAFILASTAVAIVYGITEAGFRTMSPAWIFLLMALVCGAGIAKGQRSVNSVRPRVSRGAYLQRLREAKDPHRGRLPN